VGLQSKTVLSKQQKHVFWLDIEIGAAVSAIIALVAASGIPRWSVVMLVVLGGLCASKAVSDLGWLKAPVPIGTPVRAIVILFLIWGGLSALGYVEWPTVSALTGHLKPRGKFPVDTLSSDKPAIPVHVGPNGATIRWGLGARTDFVDNRITFDIVDGEIQITTEARDRLGHMVVEIKNNDWRVSGDTSVSWDKNYIDDTLEVKDGHGRVILQVEIFPDHAQLQGEWHDEYNHGMRFIEGPNGSSIFGPFTGDLGQQIKPIMKYPSSKYQGQFVDTRQQP
jgi:hypothetical protein